MAGDISWKTMMKKCLQAFIFGIQNKCKFLYHAVNIVLKEKENSHLSWQKVCENAVV